MRNCRQNAYMNCIKGMMQDGLIFIMMSFRKRKYWLRNMVEMAKKPAPKRRSIRWLLFPDTWHPMTCFFIPEISSRQGIRTEPLSHFTDPGTGPLNHRRVILWHSYPSAMASLPGNGKFLPMDLPERPNRWLQEVRFTVPAVSPRLLMAHCM